MESQFFFYIEQARDKRVARDDEYSDSEDEGDNRKDTKSFKEPPAKKKPCNSPSSTPVSDSKATDNPVDKSENHER